ncbi:unnamed protein product (macronuclear) [Paramecium tetraurelia]|uniref:Large ribosomal subunit protein bL12 C-terminal domain-containing protein n=1 Tax=Paramecium tetraurelia TaxID=5888 RepID=A0D8B1_PARTE|nr:uncharacterized protein GSPATT00014245001 [Paramecium tetraurelia]CAK79278.1 unnamed protein product [Paramecium tetraurelia]|eukprot:XP_001446675.1 hypothetical protein (macronuclear) [Paramecium tetraurelia strain d4-2]
MLTKSIRLFRQFRFCSAIEEITKKQAEWSAIAKQKTQSQQEFLEQALSQDQKQRVKAIADACCELDLFELQCLMSLLNENHYKAQGIGLFQIDSNWPVIKQNEVPTWPPKEKEQIEAYMKELFGENVPDFKAIFGGVGSIGSQAPSQSAASSEAPKQEQKKAEAAPKVEAEKKNYDVELSAIDAAQKIKIIKEVRQLLNLGLKEAKDLVEKLPANLGKQVPKEKANELKEKLTAAGCTINLK